MSRREVRVSEQFFSRLDEQFPGERSAEGAPSATDFLLHDLPNVIDVLAEDFHRSTLSSGFDDATRVLVA